MASHAPNTQLIATPRETPNDIYEEILLINERLEPVLGQVERLRKYKLLHEHFNKVPLDERQLDADYWEFAEQSTEDTGQILDWGNSLGLSDDLIFDTELDKAWTEKTTIEADQQRARHMFDMVARPMIKKLGVLDLPNELLLKIFKCLEDFEIDWADTLGWNTWPGNRNKEAIKNSRLVCRRFCDLSSQFLVRLIRVAPNMESVSRLEDISRHPTISKGVAEVWLAPNFHSPSLDDLQRFTSYILSQLNLVPTHAFDEPRSDCSFQENLLRVRHLTETVENTGNTAQPAKRLRRSEDPFVERLRQVFAKYQNILHTEKLLMLGSGRFVARVTEAIARMPHARNLTIDDGETVTDYEPWERWVVGSRRRAASRFRWFDRDGEPKGSQLTWDHVEQFILAPIVDLPYHVLPPDYMYKFIVPMLTSLHTSGVFLNSLELRLAYPTHYAHLEPANMGTGGREQWTAAMQRLKCFVFSLRGANRNIFGDDAADVHGLHQFLAATLDTSSLEQLHLCAFPGTPVRYDPEMIGMINLAEVMGTSRPRPRLDHIRLDWVVFDANRFREIIRHPFAPSLSEIRLDNVCLLVDGDRDRAFEAEAWRHVLDQLREKRPAAASVTNPTLPVFPHWNMTTLYSRIFDHNDKFRHRSIPDDLPWDGRFNNAQYYLESAAGGWEFPNPFDLYIVQGHADHPNGGL
ncbi:hypothetical protein QBC37DRAFT_482480 [Rhypophila decipiens]|uniref:F-box domain-containing protein n=1 Tax=Rhypophila decipiens TaxID=261697 RepID=A0AAN6YCI5_9PEZI|nr:hypothetical protein QBC37DRAFT_482480 [Rhypophila decipiens]